jgi:hypothetical protein
MARYDVGDTVKVGFGIRAKVKAVTTMGHYKLDGQGDLTFRESELTLVQRVNGGARRPKTNEDHWSSQVEVEVNP